MKFFATLKFQIAFAITLLTLLFASATLYSLHVIDLQHSDDVLVRLAGRLQFNQQHLTVQAMRYQENAPRDYPSYYRDLRLYFVDLQKTRDELAQLINAFSDNRFAAVLDEGPMAMPPRLAPPSQTVARELAAEWRRFVNKLDERIGPDPAEPRLEWAAEWITEHNSILQQASERLFATLRNDVKRRAERANGVHRLLLGLALLVAVLTMLWFYRRVLRPLSGAVQGFRQVANGDFSHRVAIQHNNEIGSLVLSFNQLSDRLDALRRLLTGLEQGADLESTLQTLARSLPSLIPVDWIGVLVRGPEGRFHLEKALSDGKPHAIGKLSFDPEKTLLEECINNREP
ncbi:MAG: HAMP domain-containing protein, partial [Gammaproteobacteria bacterium]|nr:HAMP domain-containing protein [Gammaproteobacteria bacterium]